MLGFGEKIVIERISPTVFLDEIEFCLRFDDINQFGNGGIG
jgi:hypothetical protein